MSSSRTTAQPTTTGPDPRWVPDTELDGFQQLTLVLDGAARYPGEPEHEVVATLVRRTVPSRERAVLYLHGWNDYFFQAPLAERLEAFGYDFFALDLRRYGRSLRSGQLAGYTPDLTEYFEEVDRAVGIVQETAREIVFMAHSTGGLIISLYLAERPGVAKAVVLNSPWLELGSNGLWRPALSAALGAVGAVSPTRTVAVPEPGFYRRSISATEDGEWDYNLNLKGDPAFLPRVGWGRAIMRGQARVAAGLDIDVPILMCISARSDFSRTWNDDMMGADLVLDVESLAARAPMLGRHVTLIRIEGGKHDLMLSAAGPRARYLAEMERWLAAYAR
ncbi:alpha/beta hydrolase [Arachnia propionica]|uniref:Alpha/beta hydrolase n=1 Tax=Arachnia propionica TaxID=1750 RepID=A0A3P1T2U2_9ACTN|nr:alpha/beta hydrolase [Arachnia propionica]RRD03699.1 alpha/beta hydrolase [Arachnia propionica]